MNIRHKFIRHSSFPNLFFALYILLFSLFLSSACNQNNRQTSGGENPSDSTIVIRAKITGMLPIGWGTKYAAEIQELVRGQLPEIDSTFIFAISVGNPFENQLDTVQVFHLTFRLTSRIAEESYLPGGTTGMMDKSGRIWDLINIRKHLP